MYLKDIIRGVLYMGNTNKGLSAAGKAKKDEFYTQYADIEKEMKHYKKHFKGKVVLCNCDDPYESNFFKFFVLNFNRLGLKKLLATSYTGSPIANKQLSIFDIMGESGKVGNTPYKAIVNTVYDKDGDGDIDMLDITELFKSGENFLTILEGDGDFRSDECKELLKEADIVVTNPPFSLFREYVAQLMEYEKKFIIIGNINALTYKEIFPLLKNNKMWIGYRFNKRENGKNMTFRVPDNYPMSGTEVYEENGVKYISVSGTGWFTNLDIKKIHDDLILIKRYTPEEYPQYDNYDAININTTSDIPCDYAGVMGVPITFMDKYNPDQFEICGMAAGNTRANGFNYNVPHEMHPNDRGGCGVINGKRVYARILIRNKHPEERRK